MTPLSVSVDADIEAAEDLYGKTVADLQENVVFGDLGVTGTLKYISDYSEAFESGENSGYYMAFHISTPGVEDATIMVNSSDEGTVLYDETTGIAICRITDKDTQVIYITAEKDGESVNAVIDLSGLELEANTDPADSGDNGNTSDPSDNGNTSDPSDNGNTPETPGDEQQSGN